MRVARLVVGQREYSLAADADVDEFEGALLEAVRSGGAVIEVPVAGDLRVEALITPGVPVVVESRDVIRPIAESFVEDPSTAWFDEFLLE